jgi:4-diphosphocytidyl-2-C-methyl-D-erythritol kinase
MPTMIASAKINLALHVTGRRNDGYHMIDTLVVFTGLGDRVSAEPADADGLVVGGPEAGPLTAEPPATNLISRARDSLREAAQTAGRRAGPVKFTLDKRLPVASGIGGGSADAAAALQLLTRIWDFRPEPDGLASVALGLGADVPMCLHNRPLIATGIGEAITSVDLGFTLDLVLVNPRVGVSTPAVFSALEERANGPLPRFEAPTDEAGFIAWLQHTRNDLEQPARAMVPAISECLDALSDSGALFARMSGSGASCFGIYAHARGAGDAAAAIQHARPDWFVAATQTLPPAK